MAAGALADVVGTGLAVACAAVPAALAGAAHFAFPVRRPAVISLPTGGAVVEPARVGAVISLPTQGHASADESAGAPVPV